MRGTRVKVALLLAGCAGIAVAAASPLPREGDVRFKTTCNYSHTLPDDPIVSPGDPGGSHLHDFTGAVSTNAASTYGTLRASRTTCNNRLDTAAYWTPEVRVDGVKRTPDRTTAYYRCGGKVCATVKAFPPGLKIVAGRSLTDPSVPFGKTGWQCDESDRGSPPATPSLPCGDLTMRVEFPDCWDGLRLDSPDHRSHMAYASGGDGRDVPNVCPAGHPVPVPELTTYTHFGAVEGGSVVTLSSGPLDAGVHGDFLQAWDQVELERLTVVCLNGQQRCESGR